MSIPLVQNNEKDSINTSIIAIKKNLERINSILGLVDSGNDIDTSEFVKKSDIVDVVQSGNMNPVTSNAVDTSNAMPVNAVTSGDMHSVTSNAVAEKIDTDFTYTNPYSSAITASCPLGTVSITAIRRNRTRNIVYFTFKATNAISAGTNIVITFSTQLFPNFTSFQSTIYSTTVVMAWNSDVNKINLRPMNSSISAGGIVTVNFNFDRASI